jgi:hypothetical protein
MKARKTVGMVAAALVLAAAGAAGAATVQWAVDANGNWSTAANWSSNPNLPSPSDDVVIDRPGYSILVTHSGGTDSVNSLTCNEGLTLSGGTLSLANNSSVNGTFLFTGGTLGGAGTVTLSGAATWTATATWT